ncbi:RluA family pseudouridine synthase [Spirochaetales bacterium NM-380-WT-3C1]|uniref:Pseudouridine synthase n=1 Tax=Bullifex porci TaxID=2606638 RepID=A0A7X2TRH0_9SPIO|nr:RluA family pseudouridine synthase [Bullifex porci]MSU05963.1 RluA family pseudouridine synthase [Bullifex porci]
MITEKNVSFKSEEDGRVDKVASAIVPRSIFSQADTIIKVNGKSVKKSQKIKQNDFVEILYKEETFEGLEAEDISLNVIYEDDAILVINKDCGMVVHPGAGNHSGTVVNALLNKFGDGFKTIDDEDSSLRPGIVHRLDKDTSGVLLIAKTREAHQELSNQFSVHSNEKIYIAICKGFFDKKRGTINKNIVRNEQNRKTFTVTDEDRGKSAITHYTVLRQFDGYALVRVRIETGRTHQIRVHMKSINHPILGDVIYSRKDSKFDVNLCLHAFSLTIDHPVTKERMTFRAKMPTRIRDVIKELSI